MPEVILHQYARSPFSEKVRLAFGLKGATWRAVEIPSIMPKPDLMPLTGGYRRTPVMQVGADIYCDTACILRALDRLLPGPTLFPNGEAGLSTPIAYWAEKALFPIAVGLAFGQMGDRLPQAFIEDRSKFAGRPIEIARLKAAAPHLVEQLNAHLAALDAALADGRAFLLGAAVGAADLAVYHPLWFIAGNCGADRFGGLPLVVGWMARVAALGHGTRIDITGADALTAARQAQPAMHEPPTAVDTEGRRLGDRVTVMPDDTGRDPVEGEIVALSVLDITIRREDPTVGAVDLHFPRAGFIVSPA